MTITIDRQQNEMIKFKDVEVGEFFKYFDSVYLKTSYLSSDDIEAFNGANAFDLSDSVSESFDDDDLVQIICSPIIIQP